MIFHDHDQQQFVILFLLVLRCQVIVVRSQGQDSADLFGGTHRFKSIHASKQHSLYSYPAPWLRLNKPLCSHIYGHHSLMIYRNVNNPSGDWGSSPENYHFQMQMKIFRWEGLLTLKLWSTSAFCFGINSDIAVIIVSKKYSAHISPPFCIAFLAQADKIGRAHV